MTGHRALEKKEITQGKNRKVQNPGGSPKEKPKGDNKKTSPTKSIFCGIFLLPFGYLDRHEKVTDRQKLVPYSYPRQNLQKRGTI